ncbi:MAG TPA: hypothetical protein VHK01_17260 [Lacipirellulaceae bacterium]|jgi:hypothetical protein|nr:hypothetical protein [Lacipirellulaceae bacterium]
MLRENALDVVDQDDRIVDIELQSALVKMSSPRRVVGQQHRYGGFIASNGSFIQRPLGMGSRADMLCER